MEYDGETSLFQTCGSCGAPIVVPSEVVDAKRFNAGEPAADKAASEITFAEEEGTVPESNETTSPDDPKVFENEEIFDETNAAAKGGVIKFPSEAFDSDVQTAKEPVESPELDIEKAKNSQAGEVQENVSKYKGEQMLTIISDELKAGRKIKAIKIFRETFRTDLKEAKEAVEAMERGAVIEISDYL